jgi:PAS domain S-box-containing protein
VSPLLGRSGREADTVESPDLNYLSDVGGAPYRAAQGWRIYAMLVPLGASGTMSSGSDADRVLGALTRTRRDEIAYFLASIVDTCDDAILTIDLDSIVTSWNAAAERLYGYTGEEAIGKPTAMLIPPNRRDEEPAILERIKRGERIEHYETVRQRKDGSAIHVSLTVSPVKNAQGEIIGASKVSREITERKRAQERQQFLIRELEHRAKNLFAVIQSIVDRTLIEGQTIAEAKGVLVGRLNALTQAHSLLAEAAWEGAPLAEIIQRVFNILEASRNDAHDGRNARAL